MSSPDTDRQMIHWAMEAAHAAWTGAAVNAVVVMAAFAVPTYQEWLRRDAERRRLERMDQDFRSGVARAEVTLGALRADRLRLEGKSEGQVEELRSQLELDGQDLAYASAAVGRGDWRGRCEQVGQVYEEMRSSLETLIRQRAQGSQAASQDVGRVLDQLAARALATLEPISRATVTSRRGRRREP